MGAVQIPRSRLASRRWRWADKFVIWVATLAALGVAYGVRARWPSLAKQEPWILVAVIFAGLSAYLVPVAIRARHQWRAFLTENNEAVEAQLRGELRRARDTQWRWAERTTIARIDALCRHNLAWTLARGGELELAVAVATENESRNAKELASLGIARRDAVNRALYEALAGDASAAEARLASVERGPQSADAPDPAVLTLAHAVVDCRTGRHADAARRLEAHWTEYESAASGSVLRTMRVIRAFATAMGGPRDAGPGVALLEGLRPNYPGEFAAMSVAWPELATFLADHRLAG